MFKKVLSIFISFTCIMNPISTCAEPDVDIIKKYPNSKFSRISKHFVLDLDDKFFKGNISPESLKRWLDNLDTAYETYADLVGDVPINGKKIKIGSAPDSSSFRLATAFRDKYNTPKHDIIWNEKFIGQDLEEIHQTNTDFFGMFHELGHMFDFDNRWVFDAEFFANLKQVYLYDNFNTSIMLDGNKYTNHNISNIFYSNSGSAYTKRLGKDIPEYSDDSLVYKFSELKEKVGWNPFKKVFRKFLSLADNLIPQTLSDRFNLFMKYFSDEIGYNASSIFTGEQQKIIKKRFNPND